MKLIKLYAFLENNLGDDLMVEILLNRYPGHLFFYSDRWSGSDKFLRHKNFLNKNYLYKKFGRINHLLNILTLYRKKDFFFSVLFKVLEKKAMCSIYIGGSIFMQFQGEPIERRIALESQKLISAPLFIVGANFGPYTSEKFLNAFRGYFRKCAGITFRDFNSYKLFSDMKHVSYAPDVVFNLSKGNIGNENTIIISVMNLQRRELSAVSAYEDEYKRFLVEICITAVKRGEIPILVSFCENQGDREMVNKIYKMLSEEVQSHTKRLIYNDNMNEIIEVFRKAKFIVASRFHAMILAMRFSKPFFALAYNSKMINVLLDCNCETFCDIKNIGKYNAESILSNYSYYNIEEYMKEAEKQFMQIDEFLNER